MADLERIIDIVLRGRDELSGTLRNIHRGMGDLDSIAQGVAGPFSDLADGVLAADAAFASLAAGGMAYALKTSMDFEDVLLDLQKVLGANESMESATAAAREMSNKFGEAFTDIIGQITQFKQAGYELEEAIGLTNDALNLMVAGDVGAAEAAENLVRILKGMGLEAARAGEAVEVINWVTNNFATDATKLADAMARWSPIAKNAGLSLKELAGFAVPIIEVFQDSEMAGTALKSVFLRLKDDTDKVTAGFQELGFSTEYIVNRKMMESGDILKDVAAKWGSLDGPMKDYVANLIFGKEHAAKMMAVMENYPKVIQIANASMSEMADLLENEIVTRLGAASNAFKRLSNSFQLLGAGIGDEFRASAALAASGFADMISALESEVRGGAFDPIFDRITDFADAAGELFAGIGKALPEALDNLDFSGLLDELDFIGEAIGGVFDDLDLTSPEGLSKAIQFAIDSISALIRTTEGMVDQFKPLWSAFEEGVKQVNTLDRETAKSFGQILGSAKLLTEAGTLAAGAFFAIGQAGTSLNRVFDTIIGLSRTVWNGLQLVFDGAARIVTNTVEHFVRVGEIMSKVPGVPDSWRQNVTDARKAVEGFQEAIKMDASAQWEEMIAGTEQAWDGMSGTAREAAGAVREVNDELSNVPAVQKTTIEIEKEEADIRLASLRAKLDESGVLVLKAEADEESATAAAKMIGDAIPDEKETAVKATADEASIKDSNDKIKKGLESGAEVKAEVSADQASVAKAKKDIEDGLDKEQLKKLEIEAKLDTARMEAWTEKTVARIEVHGKNIQTALEWEAKVDIADIESKTRIVEGMFENLRTIIDSTGQTMSALFSQITGDGVLFGEKNRKLMEQINEESRMRTEAHQANMEMLDIQKRLFEAQLAAMESGDGLNINVEATNLSGPLEMIFNEVISLAHIKGVENRARFLTEILPDGLV